MIFKPVFSLIFLGFSINFLFSQNFSLEWREIDSTEYENIFFNSSVKSPEDIKSYNLEKSLKQYLFVLYYKDKAIFSDPISKRGGYNIGFGKNVNFCFLASILKPEEIRKIELFEDYRVKMKYEIENPEFLCSANYKMFTVDKNGKITKNDPFYPFLTSKIFEVVVSNEAKFVPEIISEVTIEEPVPHQELEPEYEEITVPDETPNKPSWPVKQ